MEVKLLTYSQSVSFLFDKENNGTSSSPKYKYALTDKTKNKSSKEEWVRLRRDVFDLTTKENVCKKKVEANYILIRSDDEAEESPDVASARIAHWKGELFPNPGWDVTEGLPEYRRNVLVVAYEDNIPVGFMLAYADTVKTYIDVLCAKPQRGKPILKAFLDWSGKRRVRLSALLHVLLYYPKFGFEFGKCDENPDLLKMLQDLPQDVFDGSKKNSEKALEFISALREKELVENRNKTCKKYKTSTFLKKNCLTGVAMERCTPKRPETFRARRSERLNLPVATRVRARTKPKRG